MHACRSSRTRQPSACALGCISTAPACTCSCPAQHLLEMTNADTAPPVQVMCAEPPPSTCSPRAPASCSGVLACSCPSSLTCLAPSCTAACSAAQLLTDTAAPLLLAGWCCNSACKPGSWPCCTACCQQDAMEALNGATGARGARQWLCPARAAASGVASSATSSTTAAGFTIFSPSVHCHIAFSEAGQRPAPCVCASHRQALPRFGYLGRLAFHDLQGSACTLLERF